MCCSKIPSSLFRTSNWVKKASCSHSPSASARLFSRSARPSRTSGRQILFPASCHQAHHNWLCMRHRRTARVNQIKIRMNGFILPLVVLLLVLDQAKKKVKCGRCTLDGTSSDAVSSVNLVNCQALLLLLQSEDAAMVNLERTVATACDREKMNDDATVLNMESGKFRQAVGMIQLLREVSILENS